VARGGVARELSWGLGDLLNDHQNVILQAGYDHRLQAYQAAAQLVDGAVRPG
jgi:hypothetical protein